MIDSSTCPTVRDGDDEIARQWAHGSLSPGAAAEFETHLLTCSHCQQAVERAAAVGAVLRADAAPVALRRGPASTRLWAIPLALAAGLATIVLWPRDPLRQLADPGPAPVFRAVTIRTVGDDASEADRGMAAYERRDFAAAAGLLGAGVAKSGSPGLRFFLGASRLLAGDAPGAVEALTPVARDAASPYAPEAQMWLAKAWLRAGQGDSATAVLEALAGRTDNVALSVHARALADSIREMRRR